MTAVGLVALLLSAAPATQTVDTIVVDNRNIFDRSGDGPGFVARLANALHVRTRASVIRRSLLVAPGQLYDSARVAESERALRALGVFRLVRVDTTRLGGSLALRVVTADGWSSKPQANYSTAGGDQTWEIGFVEENFLGTASELGVSYGKTPDRRRLDIQYVNPHFLVPRTTLLLRYGHFSDAQKGAWQVGVPFYQTAARLALVTYGESARERVLIFRDGALLADSLHRILRLGVTGGVALHATSRDYVRLLLGGEWRREDFAQPTTVPFPRSTFTSGRVAVEIRHVRFRVLEHFNSYARREDVDVSQALRLGALVESGVGYEARGQVSTVWRGGYVLLYGEASGLDSTRLRGQLTIVSQNLPRQTLIAHVEGGRLERQKPGAEFDLWLDQRGPRLYGAHAFTGTRTTWLAFEDRILVANDLWGMVGLGIAPFFDYGGAWYADEPARLGGNAGVALRFGPTRAVRGDAGELAVGYRFGAGTGWAIALRRGFRF
ncbi:MAG TPA: hypothetical protein VKC15_15655 [Gemmatimonadales bacterium]|nr:hypothetical protein [Gemmatimonadales bacterium]